MRWFVARHPVWRRFAYFPVTIDTPSGLVRVWWEHFYGVDVPCGYDWVGRRFLTEGEARAFSIEMERLNVR